MLFVVYKCMVNRGSVSYHQWKCKNCGLAQEYGRFWGTNKYPGFVPWIPFVQTRREKKKWNVKHYWQPKRKICECNVALRCLVCWLIRLRARHMAGHEWLLILQTLNVWLIWISGTGSNRCCGICLCSDFNGGCRRWLAIYWWSAPIALAIQFVKKRVDLTIVRDRGKLGLVVAFNYK